MRLSVGFGLFALLGAGCTHQADRPAPAAQPVSVLQASTEAGTKGQAAAPKPVAQPDPSKPWVVQPVKADANAQAASVSEALKTGKYPERLSMMVSPKPFSAEAYAKDPAGYVNIIEPGRCFQTAQPGESVPQLVPAGATAANVKPNESVRLAVQTKPGYPASFTSTDLGSFENQLNAITVVADGDGVASVAFTASPGVSHIVHIIAGSPVASGQVNFQVDVQIQGIVPPSESSSQGQR